MIKNIRIIVLNSVCEFYRDRVFYCCGKAKLYERRGNTNKSIYWTNRAAGYFIRECNAALKIIELAS